MYTYNIYIYIYISLHNIYQINCHDLPIVGYIPLYIHSAWDHIRCYRRPRKSWRASWRPFCRSKSCLRMRRQELVRCWDDPWKLWKTELPGLVICYITMENHHLWWIFPWKMVIFHSCVSLPEGKHEGFTWFHPEKCDIFMGFSPSEIGFWQGFAEWRWVQN